ncbi:MAG: ribonuclease HI family protein [candidate division NC10 bacterium]|nr:ribonuclease HI family protein [candidate division NC10 bacterium]
MKEPLALMIYIDGASRGNPGPAGIGIAVVGPGGELLAEESVYIGEATNNVAEYSALLAALRKAKEMGAERVQVRTDSELLYRQMQGRYRVRSPRLMGLFQEVLALSKGFVHFRLQRIPRRENGRADQLANLAIDASVRTAKADGAGKG